MLKKLTKKKLNTLKKKRKRKRKRKKSPRSASEQCKRIAPFTIFK